LIFKLAVRGNQVTSSFLTCARDRTPEILILAVNYGLTSVEYSGPSSNKRQYCPASRSTRRLRIRSDSDTVSFKLMPALRVVIARYFRDALRQKCEGSRGLMFGRCVRTYRGRESTGKDTMNGGLDWA